VIGNVLGIHRLEVGTSPTVEGTHRRDPNGRFEWISLYNHSGRIGNSFHPPIPIHDVGIELTTARPVRRITSLVDGKILKNSEKNAVNVALPVLEAYDIVLVEFAD
jgi:hypothetical protein